MSLARNLEEALTELADALGTGDARAAAPAAERLARLCREGAATGARVTQDELTALLEAQARAEVAALAERERVVRELERASTGRRAALAYDS